MGVALSGNGRFVSFVSLATNLAPLSNPFPKFEAYRKDLVTGTIDIHVHSDPDSRPRSLDALEVARRAKAQGMRGIVLKNHYDPTGGLAYIVRKEVPGLEVFGGIALNLTVGGINAAAVEHIAEVSGGWGRIVWMPTFDSENQVRYSKENRPFVRVTRNGAGSRVRRPTWGTSPFSTERADGLGTHRDTAA